MRRRRSPNNGDKSDNLVNGERRSPESTARSLRISHQPQCHEFSPRKGDYLHQCQFLLVLLGYDGAGSKKRGVNYPIFRAIAKQHVGSFILLKNQYGMFHLLSYWRGCNWGRDVGGGVDPECGVRMHGPVGASKPLESHPFNYAFTITRAYAALALHRCLEDV